MDGNGSIDPHTLPGGHLSMTNSYYRFTLFNDNLSNITFYFGSLYTVPITHFQTM